MAGVGDVPALVGHYPGPAQVSEGFPNLSGGLPEAVEGRVNRRRVYESHRTRHEPVPVCVGALHAGMGRVGGPIDLLGEKPPVVVVYLSDFQGREGFTLMGQQDSVANSDI